MSTTERIAIWLARAWWSLIPPFAMLVARLCVDRLCGAPYELLPSATTVPILAWLLAGLYVAAHAWLVAAYLLTVEAAGALLPTWSALRTAWRGHLPKLVLATVIFAIEYAPVSLWRVIGNMLDCGPMG